MNKLKIALLWGSIVTLLMGSNLLLAQDYQGGSREGYGGQPSYQYPSNQGGYYSQYYRPRMLPAPTVKVKSPVDLLEDSINKVLAFLSRPQQASLEQITFFLKKEITPHFDFKYMSRWIAGSYYKGMSPQQRKQFTETFAELFITTFVQKISNYRTYPPVVEDFISRRTSASEALASAVVLQENGRSIEVDFKFIRTPGGWKVIDVRANGVSALFYYRNFFEQQVQRQKENQATFN